MSSGARKCVPWRKPSIYVVFLQYQLGKFDEKGFKLCCNGMKSTKGIPFPARASRRLFTTKILLAGGTTAYCALSQKVLKGAAARMFVYWLCIVLVQYDDGSLRSQFLSVEMQNVCQTFWCFLICVCGMLGVVPL